MNDELEKFIGSHRDELDKAKPNPEVLHRILQQMQNRPKKEPKGILISFRTLQWAAVGAVLITSSVVFWLFQRPDDLRNVRVLTIAKIDAVQSRTTVAKPQNPAIKSTGINIVDHDLLIRKKRLLAELKSKNLISTRQVAFAGLNNMDSPASRIMAIGAVNKLKNTGNEVVNALVQTLNNDPSANVRMAALDGLAQFYREDNVRKSLAASLKFQRDPVVQIALIDLLTRMKTSGILSELEKLVNDDNTEKAVKDYAYSSMFRLRSS